MLLSGANICGQRRNNKKQRQLAKDAERLTNTIASDIEISYFDDSYFIKNQ
jgi:hypothetical protein